MTSIMSQAWKIVKPHTPLIRFRKGGSAVAAAVNASPKLTVTAAQSKGASAAVQRPVIEDYQLPFRYRRQPLDDKEIDAINSGGAF